MLPFPRKRLISDPLERGVESREQGERIDFLLLEMSILPPIVNLLYFETVLLPRGEERRNSIDNFSISLTGVSTVSP